MLQSFLTALGNVLLTIMYIIPGFLVCKGKKALPQHLPGLSGVLIYICSPCMILNALFEQHFTLELIKDIGIFFLLSLAAMTLFMLLTRVVIRKIGADEILCASAVMGNVGFFGLPIVRMLLPDHPEASAFSIAYILSMNVLAFTVGVYELTGDRKFISLKNALVNPTGISCLAAAVLCALGVPGIMPAEAKSAIKLVGDMCTPLCLFILGIRLADMSVKEVFLRKEAYAAALLKLLLFPLFAFVLVVFLPVSPVVRASMVILSGTPCASVLFNLAEMHGSSRELTADCCLLSTMVCFLSIPILTLLT